MNNNLTTNASNEAESPAFLVGAVMPSYSLEEVRLLLQKQKEQTIFSLGLSSAVYVYPKDYEKMKEWMMNCPLVL
jgi:hypothetical protein